MRSSRIPGTYSEDIRGYETTGEGIPALGRDGDIKPCCMKLAMSQPIAGKSTARHCAQANVSKAFRPGPLRRHDEGSKPRASCPIPMRRRSRVDEASGAMERRERTAYNTHPIERKKLYICKASLVGKKISFVAWALEFYRVGASGLMPMKWASNDIWT